MITPSFSLTATERVLPKLALDFTTASLDSRVTFTRTTSASNPATYVNSSGYVTSATNNQPRFDYDPVALTCKGLLIEESRANALAYSSDFRNTALAGETRPWTLTRSTITTSANTSPDNTSSGNKFIGSSTSGTKLMGYPFSVTSGTTYTLSIYAKAGEANLLRFGFRETYFGGGATSTTYSVINLTTGAYTKASYISSMSVTAAGNSWWRISITALCTTTSSNTENIASLAGTFTVGLVDDFTGNDVDGLYLWGAQLETGAFATSYIPTTSTALTRNADVATMTGTNFSDWFNASEGSFAAQYDRIGLSTAGSQGYLFNCAGSAGSGANRLAFYQRTSSQEGALVLDNNVTQFNPNAGAASVNTVCKATLGYKASNYGTALNGASPVTQASGTVPSATLMYIGSRVGTSDYLNGHLQKLSYWPQRLINAEIQAFSK